MKILSEVQYSHTTTFINTLRLFLMGGWEIPLGRTRHRWEDNIRWLLEKLGGKVWVDFIWVKVGTSG
jgi:hypothetical protein